MTLVLCRPIGRELGKIVFIFSPAFHYFALLSVNFALGVAIAVAVLAFTVMELLEQ